MAKRRNEAPEQITRRSFLEKALIGVGALSSGAIVGSAALAMEDSDGAEPALASASS